MIKISFPADDKAAALEFGKALLAYSGETVSAATTNDGGPIEGAPVITTTTDAETERTDTVGAEETLQTSGLDESMGQTAAGTDAKVDPKGVKFHPDYCAIAKDPFYASGAKKDQWKTKRGVTDEAYNAWYFDQLTQQGIETATTEQTDINVGAAFQHAETTQETATIECPADAGEYMVWVSELQAAGRISEEQLNAAYAEAGIPNVFTLFQEGGYAGVQKVFPIMCRMAGL